MEASQMTLEEIDTIHNNFKEVIIRLINEGSKFEEVLYLARRFIRVNYYNCSTNMGTTWNMIYNWAKEYEKEKITIVIDPLDGSNNFYSNLPYFGTSIALQKNNETIAGFVTNLISGIITYRAFENDIKFFSLEKMEYKNIIEVPKNKISIFERAYNYPKICEKLTSNHIKFRTLGAVALSLSNAFNYEFVLYCGKIREFDVVASMYINKNLYV